MSDTETALALAPDSALAWSLAAHLWEMVSRLHGQGQKLSDENGWRHHRVDALEHRAALDSGNSSRPPSSDGLSKAGKSHRRTASLRKKSGRKKGRQAGRKGPALRQSEHADEVIDHYPQACRQWGNALSGDSDSYVCRQVFDLPEPAALKVPERCANQVICNVCRIAARATFPLQDGERLSAVVSCLPERSLPCARAPPSARAVHQNARRASPFYNILARLFHWPEFLGGTGLAKGGELFLYSAARTVP